jgi:hypothetical protein
MRKRQERERQKKEKEAMELVEARRKEEQQALARLQQEETRQREEARGAQQQQAAGAGGGGRGGVGMGSGGASDDPQLDAMTQRRQQRAQEQGRTPAVGSSRVPSGSQQQQQQQPGQQQHQAQPLRATRVPTGGQADPMYGVSAAAPSVPNVQPGESSGSTAAAVTRTSRNSFPHAFERWEALSAHWEGMTSFWIRKLQENTQELDRNPVSAQLSRQVSDLSAAGANLFHAVVELQRLRASSERKFQRWFYETRNELERHQEEKATLQRQLDEERMNRQAAIDEAVKKTQASTQASSKTLKQLSEMRKELMISKEEARRAWEELGRREQEERDRTISLQNGLPTTVGGVQVVPMTQGVPSRQTSTRTQQQQQQQQPQRPNTRSEEGPGYEPSPQHHGYTQSPPQQQPQPGPSSNAGQSYRSGHDAGYYEQHQQQPEAAPVQGRSDYGAASEDNASDDGQEFIIDDHGRYVLDSQGKRIPFRSPGPVSGGSTPEPPMASQPSGTNYPPSSSQWAYSGGQPDYSGQGYDAPWDSVSRSHHPTRLSDVIEEDDERSRTSASQVSRA